MLRRTWKRSRADSSGAATSASTRPDGAFHSDERTSSNLWFALFGIATMFVIELSTASSTGSLVLTIGSMRSGSEGVVMAGALAVRLWMPTHARQASLGLDVAKIEALIGFVAGLVLLAASVPVAYHALARLLLPTDEDARTAMSVLCLGICVNIAAALVISRPRPNPALVRSDPEAVESPLLEMPDAGSRRVSCALTQLAIEGQLIDAEVSALLLVGLAVADLGGWPLLDALTSLAGAFLISVSASKIMVREGAVLIDLTTPEEGRPARPPDSSP